MKRVLFVIIENTRLCEGIYRMRLRGDCSDIVRPGQFVNIALPDKYLRRPISVCDVERGKGEPDTLSLIYKILGSGTAYMASLRAGESLDLLTGLGNGFDTACSGERPLLIGGGVGIPPLYGLCKELLREGKRPKAVLGYHGRSDIFYAAEFEALGIDLTITTEDGSVGEKGFVSDGVKALEYDYFYTCGPEGMLRAVYAATKTSGQLSFERRMGCGFGSCMGCSCRTITGFKRICKEGPVLLKEEIKW